MLSSVHRIGKGVFIHQLKHSLKIGENRSSLIVFSRRSGKEERLKRVCGPEISGQEGLSVVILGEIYDHFDHHLAVYPDGCGPGAGVGPLVLGVALGVIFGTLGLHLRWLYRAR
jgi:hypothetical protein